MDLPSILKHPSRDMNMNSEPRKEDFIDLKDRRATGSLINSSLSSIKADRYGVKAGRLFLQHREGHKSTWLPVFVTVHRTTFEHFAVVSTDPTVSAQAAYLRLRKCTCGETGTATQVMVIQDSHEGTALVFDTGELHTVSGWVKAFSPHGAQPPGCSSTCSTPARVAGSSPVIPPLTTLWETAEEEE